MRPKPIYLLTRNRAEANRFVEDLELDPRRYRYLSGHDAMMGQRKCKVFVFLDWRIDRPDQEIIAIIETLHITQSDLHTLRGRFREYEYKLVEMPKLAATE